jgi:hypothetical protein
MTENFESIVKEIDEMLINRDIDKLIKKHEKKIKENNQKEELTEKKPYLNCKISINTKNNIKEEIFELPTRKVRRTITVSC